MKLPNSKSQSKQILNCDAVQIPEQYLISFHGSSLQCTGGCCVQCSLCSVESPKSWTGDCIALWKVLYWRQGCSAESPEARDGQITLLSHQLQQKQPCHGQHNKHDDDHHHDGNDEDNYYDDPL